MGTPTANKGYTVPTNNGDYGVWGPEVGNNFTTIDLNLGGIVSVAMSGTTVASTSEADNLIQHLTGTSTAAATYLLPEVGGIYDIQNASSGAVTIGVGTVAAIGSVVAVPAGSNMLVTTDGTNAAVATDAFPGSVAIAGSATVGGTLSVTGSVSAAGQVSAGTLSVSGTASVTGEASVGTLAIGGITVPAVLRGYLGGLGLSNDGVSPNTVLDVAAGTGADEIAEAGYITVASPTTINCATTGAGGLDSGSLAANTSYAAFVIRKADGTSAGYASTSLTPTLPAGYTLRRRIGLFKTDASAHILPFIQNGNYFWYSPPIAGAGTTIGTTAGLIAAGAPSGIAVTAIVGVQAENSSAGIAVLISSPSVTDIAPNVPGPMTFFANANQWASGQVAVLTDGSGNFRARSTQNSTAFDWTCLGWFDPLGQS